MLWQGGELRDASVFAVECGGNEVREFVETRSALEEEGADLQGGEVRDNGVGFLLGLLSCSWLDYCEGRLDRARMDLRQFLCDVDAGDRVWSG